MTRYLQKYTQCSFKRHTLQSGARPRQRTLEKTDTGPREKISPMPKLTVDKFIVDKFKGVDLKYDNSFSKLQPK